MFWHLKHRAHGLWTGDSNACLSLLCACVCMCVSGHVWNTQLRRCDFPRGKVKKNIVTFVLASSPEWVSLGFWWAANTCLWEGKWMEGTMKLVFYGGHFETSKWYPLYTWKFSIKKFCFFLKNYYLSNSYGTFKIFSCCWGFFFFFDWGFTVFPADRTWCLFLGTVFHTTPWITTENHNDYPMRAREIRE